MWNWIMTLGIGLLAGGLPLRGAPAPDYSQLRVEAEQFYAEKSFARARECYSRVALTNLPAAEAQWVRFRLGDTGWRSEAATRKADRSALDQARQQLISLAEELKDLPEKPQLWAEVNESLGDSWQGRNAGRDPGAAWVHYERALDAWAGSSQIDLARERYLNVVWKTVSPPSDLRGGDRIVLPPQTPLWVLENALKIATNTVDHARAHLLIALWLTRSSPADNPDRIEEAFESAMALGKENPWYDDALFQCAEWLNRQGRAVPLANGRVSRDPDPVRALALYQRLVREFAKGESRYFEPAQRQIQSITQPLVNLEVPHFFRPGSEIEFHFLTRNVTQVKLALYPIQFARDVKLAAHKADRGLHDWLETVDVASTNAVKEWTRETGDRGDHRDCRVKMALEEPLPAGAYLLEARAGNILARELVLVTDTVLVLKAVPGQLLAYVCDAQDGSPVPNALLQLWQRHPESGAWKTSGYTARSGQDGLALIELKSSADNGEFLGFAEAKERQTFSFLNIYGGRFQPAPWRIYAITDRPAYRPGETVQWKIIARRYDGSVLATPRNQELAYEIVDPRGTKVKSDRVNLNAFGSAWGSLALSDTMPLGEYRIAFQDPSDGKAVGDANLFRLEEYRLPEFKLTIQTPEEKGRKRTLRLGDVVEASVLAEYYFGGPVANAAVEIRVRQRPYYIHWPVPREYPWYYEDSGGRRWRPDFGPGQVIRSEKLKTDAQGKATIRFETLRHDRQDYEYEIEARITDAARREVVGAGRVRVTQQHYYVQLRPPHLLYRPQDKVTVEIHAKDANDQPVQTEGHIQVTREFWYEIWIAPDGREIKGRELEDLRRASPFFPPLPDRPGVKPWRLKFRGYEKNEILSRNLKTATNGLAEFSFAPEREGYYRVAWDSDDADPAGARRSPTASRIKADTTVWVCTGKTTDLGYRHGGVEIILDQDTFKPGQRAPVLLTAQTSDRYVLFCATGDDLYHHQLVHLEGTTRLIEIAVEEKHSPNFYLDATLISDGAQHQDIKQVVVPPVDHFLQIELEPDRESYSPQDEGQWVVKTRDYRGEPVSAEVALGLVDEAVYYIQGDYAEDPRMFFFGRRREPRLFQQTTLQQKPLVKWRRDAGGELFEEREAYRHSLRRALQDLESQAGGDLLGQEAFGWRLNAPVDTVSGRKERAFFVTDASGPGARGLALGIAPASAPMSTNAKGIALEELSAKPDSSTLDSEATVQVRTDFRSTVFWQPDVVTDGRGEARVKVKYPDALTTWKATARAASQGSQFGLAQANTRTRRPLMVRLQTPRFLVAGDEAVVSAVINNQTGQDQRVRLELKADGLHIVSLDVKAQDPVSSQIPTVLVAANGEGRVDWKVQAHQAGQARLQVKAVGDSHGDAMEKTLSIWEHGIETFMTKSGKLAGGEARVRLELPAARKQDTTELVVQIAPSLAVTMLDALPYLADYPYGCTEQTLSRFLPAVVVSKTLRELGRDPEDITSRVFGGIETGHTNRTHPKGPQDLRKLDDMVRQGLDRLYDFQHADGGWGWWKEGDTDRFMTAYVVWGLALAQKAGVNLKADVLDRAVACLDQALVEADTEPDLQTWMLHALAVQQAAAGPKQPSRFQQTAFDNLWIRRDQLNAYTRALLALSAHQFGLADQARTLVRNLENGVIEDNAPDQSVLVKPSARTHERDLGMSTAHWGEDGLFWRWSEGGIEATAFALSALLAIEPQHPLVTPVMNWLVKNRRGAQWSNTRDTAIVVLALTDYLRTTRELAAPLEYEVIVNGKTVAEQKLSPEDAFGAPSRIHVDPGLLRDGPNEVWIRNRHESGPLYFSVHAKYFSLEEPVPAAGHEIFAQRRYFRMADHLTLLKGYVQERVPLREGETVTSGDRIQVELLIEAKNNYEYLVFEDLKPAGLEATQVRSGEALWAWELKSAAATNAVEASPAPARARIGSAERRRPVASLPPRPRPDTPSDTTGRSRWVYQELRDRKIALFLDRLPEGYWRLRYEMRAETPGVFHALPVLGHAMYVPEIHCHSDEQQVRILDKAQ